jgi:hypothetical protein
MVTSGTVTVAASSSIKDVAGNAVTGTLSRSSTGTKRVIGVNCGNHHWAQDGYEFEYTPPFVSDNGFQGNEPAAYFTGGPNYTYSRTDSVDMSYVTSPAPEAVYQTIRAQWDSSTPISYSIPVPSGTTYTVRLHFAEIYFNDDFTGYQVFDIKVNGTVEYTDFDILAQAGTCRRAYIQEFSGIAPSGGNITVDIVPKLAVDGYYRAAINGIEIVKP